LVEHGGAGRHRGDRVVHALEHGVQLAQSLVVDRFLGAVVHDVFGLDVVGHAAHSTAGPIHGASAETFWIFPKREEKAARTSLRKWARSSGPRAPDQSEGLQRPLWLRLSLQKAPSVSSKTFLELYDGNFSSTLLTVWDYFLIMSGIYEIYMTVLSPYFHSTEEAKEQHGRN
jgi:hypothetical protein